DSPTGTMDTRIAMSIKSAELNGYGFDEGAVRAHWRWTHQDRGYKGGEVVVDELSLRKGRGTLSASGRMLPGGHLQLTAVAQALSVRQLEGLGTRFPGLSGNVGFVADVQGTLAIPQAHIDVSGTGLAYQGRHLGDARAY